jgi:hypothetical protein
MLLSIVSIIMLRLIGEKRLEYIVYQFGAANGAFMKIPTDRIGAEGGEVGSLFLIE